MRVDVTVLPRASDGTRGIVPDDNRLGLRQWNVVATEDEQPDADREGETPIPAGHASHHACAGHVVVAPLLL